MKLRQVLWSVSSLTLTTSTWSRYSEASCFRPGSAWRHGPHQVAQNSIRTKWPATLDEDELLPIPSEPINETAGVWGTRTCWDLLRFSSFDVRVALGSADFRARRAGSPSGARCSDAAGVWGRYVSP